MHKFFAGLCARLSGSYPQCEFVLELDSKLNNKAILTGAAELFAKCFEKLLPNAVDLV